MVIYLKEGPCVDLRKGPHKGYVQRSWEEQRTYHKVLGRIVTSEELPKRMVPVQSAGLFSGPLWKSIVLLQTFLRHLQRVDTYPEIVGRVGMRFGVEVGGLSLNRI